VTGQPPVEPAPGGPTPNQPAPLARLLERLLAAAETALAAGDQETARATAEEVLAVDPDNPRATALLAQTDQPAPARTGERALMTLLFADLVASTALSEQVEPEQLRDLFGLYRATAREAVERYGGYVMKYMGDGILAGFGYPDPHEDDARRAVLAGLDLVAAMRAMQGAQERRLGVRPQVRIGIHTGRVVVADLSDEHSSDERDSIVGAAPNLAARIQSAASPDQVVISDVTQHLVETDFFVQSHGVQDLKGIRRPVEVFAVSGPSNAAARFHAERYRRVRLVARDHERGVLVSAWDGARAGDGPPGPYLVLGEAGIGKTRLVADVVNTVERAGGSVLGTGCLPYYANVALWPIAQMLERAIAVSGISDRRQLLLDHLASLGMDPARTVPFLGPLIGVTDDEQYPAPQLDPAAALDETLNQFVAWLDALGARAPRLFVVEDLHWADPSTLALLGRLAQQRPPGVLVLATSRPGTAIPWQDQAQVLRLEGLRDSAATRLVDALAGASLTPAARRSIVERADGNPLFIEELTRSLQQEERKDPLPLRLQELFTWRLKAPGVDLAVAQTAATVGPAFDGDVVADAVGDPAGVAGQLVVLTNAGIIEPIDPQTHRYRFRHALLRDAAYETQVLDDRVRAHARVAEALLDRGAEPALVAEHLDRAGDAEGATEQYLLGAQDEQARGAHAEAAELFSRALERLSELPESADRDLNELTARMLRSLSVSAMHGYAAPDVQSDQQRAEALTNRLGDRPEVLPSLIAIWAYWFTSGELGTGRGLIDRLLGMIADPAYAWFAPEVDSCAGWQALYEGRLAEARQFLDRAMAGFSERPPEDAVSAFWPLPNDPIAVTAIAQACLATIAGQWEQAADWERRALARTEQIGFPRGPWSAAFVKTYGAWMRMYQGRDRASRELGAEVVDIGAEHGYAYWQLLGSSYLLGTDPAHPDRGHLAQIITTLRAMGQEAFAASNLAALARLCADEGDLTAAADLVEQALEVVRKTGEAVHLPELLRQRAALTLARGRSANDALEDLTAALAVADEQGAAMPALRSALALAGLPPEVRPSRWRATLAQARASVPAALATPETAAADTLLA
jgi:class 3 adenylate cyclase/tetratricopeptide (TPR) repeat protein